MAREKIVSPSRTYVAMCNKANWNGHYFRKFTLPETMPERLASLYEAMPDIRNTTVYAEWWFLNILNHSACIDKCVTWEDYSDLSDQKEWWRNND